jgi:hypothetical protein
MAEELFWTKWSAIAQILAAVGTLAAVVVSLYLARRGEKPKLVLTAGIRLVITPGEEGPFPRIVDITVRNKGVLSAHISQYGWQTGVWRLKWPSWLARQRAVQNPGLTGYGVDPPFELPPGQKRLSALDYDNFLEGIEGMSGDPFFARRWPLIGLRPTPAYIVAYLESGITIKAPVESDFASALFETECRRAVRHAAAPPA